MKKTLFLCVVFIIMSQGAYTQYLAKNDIDIFIKGFDSLNEIINWYEPAEKDKKEWEGYRSAVSELFRKISDTDAYFSEPKDFEKKLSAYKKLYLELINYKAPKELDAAFNKAGWKNNGNKIFWTIHYGCNILINKEEIELFLGMIREKFDPDDFDEYEEDEIQEMEVFIKKTNLFYSNISKLLDFINPNDRKIIEDRFYDLIGALE